VLPVDVDNLRIVKYPDPLLHAPCAEITEFGPELEALARSMMAMMYKARGVGLAGPQIGLSQSIFVANPDGQPSECERAYINPVILEQDGQDVTEEGCLSLPGISCRVKRATLVRIRAQDLQGNTFEETVAGLLARIFQHEIDHLNGILLSDKMSPVARMANRRTLKELEETDE
jgi:peptide deformylase